MTTSPRILHDADLDAYLAKLDVMTILKNTFAALHRGDVVQPPQTLTLFPCDRGDFITYTGVLGHVGVFGAKLSPYIPADGGPIITAWTVLMSMRTGLPLLLCDAQRLTRERTAATTALAVDLLARTNSRVLAVFGTGKIAHAHVLHALKLRDWSEIRVFSLSLAASPAEQALFRAIDPRVRLCATASDCARGADVIMLATSAGTPVIDTADIKTDALVTSISTNVAKAHEIEPAALAGMDVYCDYRATTPDSAGEMVLAAAAGLWSNAQIKGDLPELCAAACPHPTYARPVFFRSIGLGIEDIAVAYAIHSQL